MNWYAYPVILDAVKSDNNNYVSIELYDEFVHIYREKSFIIIKHKNTERVCTEETFNFFSNKPIEKITLVKDKYGFLFHDVFNKKMSHAAKVIQKSWAKRK